MATPRQITVNKRRPHRIPNKHPVTSRAGTLVLDPHKIVRLLAQYGWSKSEFCDQNGLSRNTLNRCLNWGGVIPKVAARIARSLGVSVDSLLPSSEEPASKRRYEIVPAPEWDPAERPGPWQTASNGLQYRVCRMRHRDLPELNGRGKFYDLLGIPTDELPTFQERLTRHARVGSRIEASPHVAKTLCVTSVSQGLAWWVIDQWVGETRLADRLGSESVWPRESLPQLMREIAFGLRALHRAKIVFRELSPSRVLLADSDGRVVLTDFELAKLLGDRPTVSNEWPDDPYRAPEVDSGQVTFAADVFSWGRILIRAATGQLPAVQEANGLLAQARLPKAIQALTTRCISPNPAQRPTDVDHILDTLTNWT